MIKSDMMAIDQPGEPLLNQARKTHLPVGGASVEYSSTVVSPNNTALIPLEHTFAAQYPQLRSHTTLLLNCGFMLAGDRDPGDCAARG